MTDEIDPWLAPIEVAGLKAARSVQIALAPDAETRRALAEALGILEIRKLRLDGTLSPLGHRNWRFEGQLGATVVQACIVTLAPVVTRIDEAVARNFVTDLEEPAPGSEVEMTGDDETEALGPSIDPGRIMAEALALALPAYPRAKDAELGQTTFAGPGITPMGDAEAHPFAGLKGLRDKLAGDDDDER